MGFRAHIRIWAWISSLLARARKSPGPSAPRLNPVVWPAVFAVMDIDVFQVDASEPKPLVDEPTEMETALDTDSKFGGSAVD